jgi:adenylate cyclase class 2
MEEIEVKFLAIDKELVERKLVDLGAKKQGEYFYRRSVFDYPDLRLDQDGAWVRLRDEGDKVMLSFKQRLGMQGNTGNDVGMYERETEVQDFNATADILRKIGLTDKFYFENKRTRYVLDSIEFDIDEWPLLSPYLEIEAKSWGDVDRAIELLGFNKNDAKKFTTTQIYELDGINDKDYQIMTFEKQVKKSVV